MRLMRLSLPPLPRLPRPRWPRRDLRPVLSRSEPGLVLRVFRGAALTTISFIITAADSAAFAESYRGLWVWARHHGLSGFWAAAFPLQVDTFIVVGELVLFVAMIDQWKRRHKAGAWAVTLLGLAASVAGNIGHVAAHDLQSRGTAAVPPVAAFAAMWVGLSVLKRVIARADETVPSDDEFVAEEPVARVPLMVVPDVVSSPLPSDAETAAAAALRATLAAGNPLSLNQLQTRFRLTRKEATEVRDLVLSGGRASAKCFAPSDTPPAPLASAIPLAAGRHVRVGRPVSPSLIAGMLMRPLTAGSASVPASRVVRLSRQFSVRLPGTGG